MRKPAVPEDRSSDTRKVFSTNASRGTLLTTLSQSPTASLLLLVIVLPGQVFPQLWQLEFKAAALNQRVSLVGFLQSRLAPSRMGFLQAAAQGFFFFKGQPQSARKRAKSCLARSPRPWVSQTPSAEWGWPSTGALVHPKSRLSRGWTELVTDGQKAQRCPPGQPGAGQRAALASDLAALSKTRRAHDLPVCVPSPAGCPVGPTGLH